MDQGTDIKSVLSKIAKLRALAKNNTSANEAAAAAAAADRLMQEHRIAEAQIESESGPACESIESIDALVSGKRSAWKERILSTLARNYECVFYMSNGRSLDNGKLSKKITYKVVGRKSDLDLVEYMYAWITSELERICKINHRGQGLSIALAFYEGAAEGLATALRQAKEASKVQATSSALVVLEKRQDQARAWVRDNVGHLRGSKSLSGSRSKNSDAYVNGYNTGMNLSAPKGISGQASSVRMLGKTS